MRGKVVVITGAAHGIGAATAEALVRQGARVALVDLDAAVVTETAARLGHLASPYVADVTDRARLLEVFDDIAAEWGRIDAVLANAGIAGPVAPISEADPDAVERVIEVDLLGVMRTAHAALPHLLASKGYLLLVASLAAAIPTPTIAGYGAAKAAVEAYGRALRIELAPRGVAVGVAYFGLIDTGLVRGDLFGGSSLSVIEGKIPWLLTPAPVEAAARVLADGIAHRRARVWAPRWVSIALVGRGVLAGADGLLSRLPFLTSSVGSTAATEGARS